MLDHDDDTDTIFPRAEGNPRQNIEDRFHTWIADRVLDAQVRAMRATIGDVPNPFEVLAVAMLTVALERIAALEIAVAALAKGR